MTIALIEEGMLLLLKLSAGSAHLHIPSLSCPVPFVPFTITECSSEEAKGVRVKNAA